MEHVVLYQRRTGDGSVTSPYSLLAIDVSAGTVKCGQQLVGGKEGIRLVGRHRCITTLSPDVTRNELGALHSQTSHRLKLSSPVLYPYVVYYHKNSIFLKMHLISFGMDGLRY